MKTKQPAEFVLRDKASPVPGYEPSMVRTQVYLTQAQHEFLTREGERTRTGLSAVLRSIIDAKMRIPEDAWANNSLLEPTPAGSEWEGPEDASLNHDHYAFGAPKKYKKLRGKWVLKAEGEE